MDVVDEQPLSKNGAPDDGDLPPASEEQHETCIDTEELQLMFNKSPSIIKCEQEQLSPREAILLVLVFFVVVVVVTLGMISGDVMKERDECSASLQNVTSLLETADKDFYVRGLCLEDTCVHTAARMMKSLDTTVEPCDDFFKYACGGWQDSNPVPPDQSNWGIKEKIESTIRMQILQTMQKPIDKSANVNSAIKKMTVLYQSCADTGAIDAAGVTLLRDAMSEIGGWSMQGGRSSWDITTSLSKLHFAYSSDALFYPFVAPNPYDKTRYTIQIAKSVLGIPNAADYSDPSKPIAQQYQEYMKSVARELGQGDPNRATFAQQVFEVEKEIAEIIVATSANERGYENTTVGELENIAGELRWIDYFTAAGFQVTRDTKILVASMEYIKRVVAMMARFDKRERSVLNNYFVWKLAMGLAMDLPQGFRDAADKYVMAVSGTTKPKPRWEYCFNSVDSYMSLALGAVYIKKHFKNKTKDKVRLMVNEFQETMKDTIESSEWLEETAREKASAKIDSLTKKIAFPKILESEAKLDAYYKYITVWFGDAYSKILTNIMQGRTRKMVELLAEKVDPDEWAIGLHITNAYYSAMANEIVLPAGILVSPYFDENNLQFINYAGTGFVIGHELMHIFDNKGDASMSEVWASTNYTDAYDAKKTCLTGYLTRQGIKDDNPTKAHVLLEGMADVDGLTTAYRAYRALSVKEGDEKVLPGIGKTADQLFFISYAQSWCESKPTTSRNDLSSGIIPSDLRVKTAVSNSEEFALAFSCSWNSAMNTHPKCNMW